MLPPVCSLKRSWKRERERERRNPWPTNPCKLLLQYKERKASSWRRHWRLAWQWFACCILRSSQGGVIVVVKIISLRRLLSQWLARMHHSWLHACAHTVCVLEPTLHFALPGAVLAKVVPSVGGVLLLEPRSSPFLFFWEALSELSRAEPAF